MKKILVAILSAILAFRFPMTVVSKDNNTWISDTAYEACVEYGEKYGIAPELLMAMIEIESDGNPYAENKGCMGLMQISPKWHWDRMERLGVTDLNNEKGNVLVGADYMAELFSEYGEVSYVLDIFNGNSKAKYNYENGILSDYSRKILERSAELERIHGKL